MSAPDREVTGVILAGGQATRMHRSDKGLIALQGRPLVAHVAQRLAPQVARLLISANRHPEQYGIHGAVVADAVDLAPWQGPLAGILAAMEAADTEWVVSVPCDTPFVPLDLVARLKAGAESHGAGVSTVRVDGSAVPVCMLVATRLAGELRQWLRQGTDRRVRHWVRQSGGVEVAFDGQAEAFVNVNTPLDLQAAHAYASQCAKSK